MADSTPRFNLETDEIVELMRRYYTKIYQQELGLPDWEERVCRRLSEHETVLPLMLDVESWFRIDVGKGTKILVVGGGTGAEFVAFSMRGGDTYAIEPNPEAVEIGRLKAAAIGVDPNRFLQGYGERIGFADNSFDLVWCFTVLEHVQDVHACLREMIRVVRPSGHIVIVTPDYRQFYEPHYKITMPMFLPKWFLRLWLRVLRRPPGFLDTLQFVNSTAVANILQNYPVMAFRAYFPWSHSWRSTPSMGMRLSMWMTRRFGIQRNQYWILRKLDEPSQNSLAGGPGSSM
jgi:ubiquinone/menaquinone biosynthesis C-methylase UbiE